MRIGVLTGTALLASSDDSAGNRAASISFKLPAGKVAE